jgi:hypothetical protein
MTWRGTGGSALARTEPAFNLSAWHAHERAHACSAALCMLRVPPHAALRAAASNVSKAGVPQPVAGSQPAAALNPVSSVQCAYCFPMPGLLPVVMSVNLAQQLYSSTRVGTQAQQLVVSPVQFSPHAPRSIGKSAGHGVITAHPCPLIW